MTKEFYSRLYNTMRSSGAVAYRYSGERRSYKELHAGMLRVNAVLGGLRNENVAMYADKKFSAYSAIFGILLSGNTWVPLSLDMPESRLIDILKQVKPKYLLRNLQLPPGIAEHLKASGILEIDLEEVSVSEKTKDFTAFDFRKDDIAYIMFTSGSTGIPKGVPMTHENYVNFVYNCLDILPFGKHGVFSDYHDFAFDISIFYLFCCPLTEGAFAPVMKETEKILPLAYIQENEITVWSSVPSVISRIQALKPNDQLKTKIEIMFLCGEPFSLKVLDYCLNNMGVRNVYDFYGLTETGVENFYHKCSAEDLRVFEPYGYVPIGRPLKGNSIKVTQEKELLLGGCQITPGYLGAVNPEKFEVIDDIRWFHSGDIVEEHEGVYFCKGRMDSQIKLKGYRIELMDIEIHMKRFKGIDEAVCFIKEKNGKKTLAAVVRPKKGIIPDLTELSKFLSGQLPHYMIPGSVYIQDEIPVNRNSKIDRRRIKEAYDNK
jgi:acyl-coenzyme A synthetase/AMP-(fatty) acid ligase